MGRQKSILFIGHDASLTGAPILLLNLLTVLQEETNLKISIVLIRGGVLENQFKSIGKTFIYRNKWLDKNKSFFVRVLSFPLLFCRRLYCLFLAFQSDFVFSNTIANGRLLNFLNLTNKPIVVYVHELATVFDYFERLKDSSSSIKNGKIFAYPSIAVKRFLVQKFDMAENTLKYLRYYFPASDFEILEQKRAVLKEQFLSKFDIPKDKFLVVGMGVAGKRKGTDIFLEVCTLVKNNNIFFVWIGGFENDETKTEIYSYIKSNALEESIRFTGSQPYNPFTLLPFDLLFLSSREDPYPLVVIEGAYNKVASLCFAGSGGIVEFVRDCGWVLDADSVQIAAEKIIELSIKPEEVARMGQLARQTALKRHSSSEILLNEFDSIINELKL